MTDTDGESDLVVCAVGASAGGLSPVEDFFSALPTDSGVAFVLIQHLASDHESIMGSLLESRTEMPVYQARDGEMLQPNHVYLIPPGTEISIAGGRMIVRDRNKIGRSLHRPIDTFLVSMATDRGPSGIAVILSGSGSDGTEGVAAVRRAGGLTLAQDGSALFGSMPEEAVRSGYVDGIGRPADLAAACVTFARTGERPATEDSTNSSGMPEMMTVLTDLITAETDISFRDYKPGTLRRRIERRLTIDGGSDMSSLIDRAERDPGFVRDLAEELLIDVTGFFRDPGLFEVLDRGVVAQLAAEASASGDPIRVWVAGCATGQEAYSMAMVLIEALDHIHGERPGIQIFATDLHHGALAQAASGVYAEAEMEGVSTERRIRFFVHDHDGWRVRPEIRSTVTFARHDLLNDSPFSRIDLVSCRNVLIYFLPSAQERVLASLSFSLRPGGVLVLGSSEALGGSEVDFEPLSTAWRVFRKKLHVVSRMAQTSRLGIHTRPRGSTPSRSDDRRLVRAYDRLLEAHFVAGFIVDDRRHLIHTIGGATQWMRPPTGRPSNDVMAMLEDSTIRLAVGAIIRDLESGVEIPTPRLVPDVTRQGQQMTLHGSSIPGETSAAYLVYARPVEEISISSAVVAPSAGDADETYVSQLELELNRTRESLQAALEEHETANEELSATNEELVASNEELQSANEELSSVNEELHTLNDENRIRLDEVLEISADLEQLMNATEIGVVFIAEDGSIRRFNEAARDFFRVRDTDISRPFADIATRIDYDTLQDDIEAVAVGGSPVLKHKTLVDNRLRQLVVRIDRYELPRGRAGVFVAMLDVTDLHLSEQERLMAKLLGASPISVVLWGEGNRLLYRNRSMLTSEGEVSFGSDVDIAVPSAVLTPKYAEALERVRATGEAVVGFDRLDVHDEEDAVVGFRDFFFVAYPIELDGVPFVGAMGLPASEVRELLQVAGQTAAFEAVSAHGRIHVAAIDDSGLPVAAINTSASLHGGAATVDLIRRIRSNQKALAAFAAGGRGEFSREIVDMELGEGVHGVIDLVVHPVDGPGTTRAVASGVDVSDLASQIDTLKDEVARLRIELSEERRSGADRAHDLAERNEDLDNFAHVAAHDLKAPIRSVRAFAELAQDTLREGGDGAELLDRVIEGADRMTSLVQSLLDFASLDRQRPTSERVDLGEIIDEALVDIGADVKRTQASIGLPAESATVIGDPTSLRQVFTNLLNNAVKYGGDPPEIEVSVRPDDDGQGVTVSVADNGMGFDMDHVERLFEPFQRLHDTSISGNGVGLAICRRIVSRHGGSIWATSEPEKGSRFSVWLPVGLAPDQSPASP